MPLIKANKNMPLEKFGFFWKDDTCVMEQHHHIQQAESLFII
jgi:hypothetical protein